MICQHRRKPITLLFILIPLRNYQGRKDQRPGTSGPPLKPAFKFKRIISQRKKPRTLVGRLKLFSFNKVTVKLCAASSTSTSASTFARGATWRWRRRWRRQVNSWVTFSSLTMINYCKHKAVYARARCHEQERQGRKWRKARISYRGFMAAMFILRKNWSFTTSWKETSLIFWLSVRIVLLLRRQTTAAALLYFCSF